MPWKNACMGCVSRHWSAQAAGELIPLDQQPWIIVSVGMSHGRSSSILQVQRDAAPRMLSQLPAVV